MNRRQWLKATGWSAGGLTLLVTGGCSLLPPLPTFGASSESDALSWIRLDEEGVVTFLLPRAELGQGIDAGLTLVVAEELQMPTDQVRCAYQRTDQMAPCQMTVGSQSVENYLRLTAVAAAALRENLLARASVLTDAPRSALRCEDGGITDGRSVWPFKRLLAEGESTVQVANVPADLVLLTERAQTRFVGGADPALHVDRITTGLEVYSRDVVLEDMVFGAVAQPPQLGVRLLEANADAAAQVSGVLGVYEGPAGEVGVVARTPMAVEAGLAALRCTWSELTPEELAFADIDLDVDEGLRKGWLDHSPVREGDVDQGAERAAVKIEGRYDTPMADHAAMEPRAGVARPLEDGGIEVWTGSQDPWFVRSAISKALGVSADRVVVRNCRVGGGFGGRVHCQASFEAAWLAVAAGRAVKVQWSREDEFRHNYVGPQFSTRIAAGLDAQGTITHWRHDMLGAPVLTSSMLIPPRLHWLANLPADPGTVRGTETPYRLANHRVDMGDVRVPMPTGPWRGLGAAPNTFAVECALDELCEAADADPFAVRVRNAKDPRLATVLDRLKVLTKGETQLGIAATAYKGVTFVAIAVALDQAADGLVIRRIWCVHDCGRMIAPDRVRAQVEGNLIWGVSMARFEDFRVQGGAAVTTNFDSYRIARMRDIPQMQIELMENDAPPSGAAEAALAPAAAAIANAVARHTGARQRALPLRGFAQ